MRDMRKRRKRKKAVFVLSIVLPVFVLFTGILGTVMAESAMEQARRERDYRIKEKELVRETRMFLNGNGYCNSGISLTRVTDEGSRSYTMTIHHGKIDRMSQEERGALKSRLEQQGAPEDLGSLEYIFMYD